MLERTFQLMLVDRRVYCSYSHCVMSRGKRYWVVSRGLSGILMLSCLLKCEILTDLVAKYLSGACGAVRQRSPALPRGSATATAHVALIRRGSAWKSFG